MDMADVIKEQRGGILSTLSSCFHTLFLFTFMVFTILALLHKNPQDISYYMNSSIRKAFTPKTTKTGYLTKPQIVEDILNRTKNIMYGGSMLKKVYMVSQLKVTFVKNIIFNSSNFFYIFCNVSFNIF